MEPAPLAALHDSFKARRMADAQRTAIAGLRRLEQARPSPPDEARAGANEQSQSQDGRDVHAPAPLSEPELARAVSSLIEKGQPELAVHSFAEGLRQGLEPSWPVSDRVAATLLHLGRPIEARVLWERRGGAAVAGRATRASRYRGTRRVRRRDRSSNLSVSPGSRPEPGRSLVWSGALAHAAR